jgi:hypothetical protein
MFDKEMEYKARFYIDVVNKLGVRFCDTDYCDYGYRAELSDNSILIYIYY